MNPLKALRDDPKSTRSLESKHPGFLGLINVCDRCVIGQMGTTEVPGMAGTSGNGGNQDPERPQSRNEERDVLWFLPLPSQWGLCAFLKGRYSRFSIGLRPRCIQMVGRSAGGWPELCQAPLPSHVLWTVACSQDSAASTPPLCSYISSLLHYDWNPLLCPQPP